MCVNARISFLFSCSKKENKIKISCSIFFSLSNQGMEKSFSVVKFYYFFWQSMVIIQLLLFPQL